MVIYFEVQHPLEKKKTVADALSPLQSEQMSESHPDEDINECNVEYVDGTFSVHNVKSSKDYASRKLTIDDFIAEQHKDASCQILKNRIDINDMPYLIDDKLVLSRQSSLHGAVQRAISC